MIGSTLAANCAAWALRAGARWLGSQVRHGRRATPHYRGFATAAEFIRFAVEEKPAVRTLGAWMQVGDERLNSDELKNLPDGPPFAVATFRALKLPGD